MSYNSIGVVTRFAIPVKNLKEILNPPFEAPRTIEEVEPEILKNFSLDIYDYERQDNFLVFYLLIEDDISTLIELMKAVSDVIPPSEPDEFKEVCEKLAGKTWDEAFDIAKERRYCCFQDFEIPHYFHYYPIKVFQKTYCVPIYIQGFLLYLSPFKTNGEDEIWPYYYFTKLLHYRLNSVPKSKSLLAFQE